MFYFIEEVLQVYINDVLISLIDVLLCLLHGLVGILARTKTITMVFEL